MCVSAGVAYGPRRRGPRALRPGRPGRTGQPGDLASRCRVSPAGALGGDSDRRLGYAGAKAVGRPVSGNPWWRDDSDGAKPRANSLIKLWAGGHAFSELQGGQGRAWAPVSGPGRNRRPAPPSAPERPCAPP